jgi:hypothetical protein
MFAPVVFSVEQHCFPVASLGRSSLGRGQDGGRALKLGSVWVPRASFAWTHLLLSFLVFNLFEHAIFKYNFCLFALLITMDTVF